MSRRGLTAVVVLALWAVGIGFLVRRELFRPDTAMFAEMGLRITPGAMFYAVMRDGDHVGFASSTIDTTEAGVSIVDVMVADLAGGTRARRVGSRSEIRLSRGMRLHEFSIENEARGRSVSAAGRAFSDSLIALVAGGGARATADTQRVKIDGPVLLPAMVPLAVALGGAPAVGQTHNLPVFDPISATQRTASVRIAAESLFVLHDSATVDPVTRRWVAALPDTVRAWQVVDDAPGGYAGWVDAQGRTVLLSTTGELTLVRMPYELAFENWQIERRRRSDGAADPDDDILESTLLASNVSPTRALTSMRLRLAGIDLAAYPLASRRQRVSGDTVTVTLEPDADLLPRYRLGQLMRGLSDDARRQWQQYLRSETQVETMDLDIRAHAVRIRAGTRDPALFAARLTRWVHDSIAKRPTTGVPSARAVLDSRAGDVNDHTQLFVALARSGSLPARAAAGLIHAGGKFYYHSWPEVYLGDWVAVDPVLGQFPADASRLRLQAGGLDRHAELLRLMGTLQIDVLDTR